MANTLKVFQNGAVGFIDWLGGCRFRIRIVFIRHVVVRRVRIPKGRELCCTSEKPEGKKKMAENVKYPPSKRGSSWRPIPTCDYVERTHRVIGGA